VGSIRKVIDIGGFFYINEYFEVWGSIMRSRGLVAYVDRMLNTGTTVIRVPKRLWVGAGKDEIEEAVALARINKVKLIFEGGPVYDFREK